MRNAPLFLTFLKWYLGLKHFLTTFSVMLDLLVLTDQLLLSGFISGIYEACVLFVSHCWTYPALLIIVISTLQAFFEYLVFMCTKP